MQRMPMLDRATETTSSSVVKKVAIIHRGEVL